LKAPLSIHPKPSKSVLAKSKFYKGDQMTRPKSYTQASKGDINEIIKIKDAFPKLSPKIFLEIYKVINNLDMKGKLKFNMTTKGLSRKQVIIPMGSNNPDRIIAHSNVYVANINSLLKNIKSEVTVDFIRPDNKDIIVTTNKVAATSDLKVIEDYIKNLNDIDSNDVMSPRLLQLKSYLKILGIPYLVEDTNLSLTYNIVERILKTTQIFNDLVLALHPCIIKVSPKYNMAVIWINI